MKQHKITHHATRYLSSKRDKILASKSIVTGAEVTDITDVWKLETVLGLRFEGVCSYK